MKTRTYPETQINNFKRFVITAANENEMDDLMQAIDDIELDWRKDYICVGLSVYFTNESHRTMLLLKGKI